MSPDTTPGRSMPEIRRFTGYLRSVARAELSPAERVRCAAIVLKWPLRHRHWRFMLWDMRVMVAEAMRTGGDRPQGSLPGEGRLALRLADWVEHQR